jgi:hypothetical protein
MCNKLTIAAAIFLLFGLVDCLSSNDNQNLRIVSTKRNGGDRKIFYVDAEERKSERNNKRKLANAPTFGIEKIESVIRSTFLPSGYPNRTPRGYLQYSVWSWIQDLSTQLRSVLATQRILEGVGVGREGATALSALMNYLVRDGCGMAATLLFTSGWSSRFRTDVKRWRLFADTILDVGITCEVAALLVPRAFFLPMISIGNACKAICGVAAGACGGSINLHWARGSDISDINAKFGAQHTVTGALGLIFAALFAHSVNQTKPIILWALYTTLTLLHIFANGRCMRLISFDSCNNARLDLLLSEFFLASFVGTYPNKKVQSELPKIPTPDDIAKIEPLFFGILGKHKRPTATPIRFGVAFDDFYASAGESFQLLEDGLLRNNREKYIISSGWTKEGKLCVLVSFLSNATPIEETKAYFHATLLGVELQERLNIGTISSLSDESRHIIESETKELLDPAWGKFKASSSEAGWDLGRNELHTQGYELELAG